MLLATGRAALWGLVALLNHAPYVDVSMAAIGPVLVRTKMALSRIGGLERWPACWNDPFRRGMHAGPCVEWAHAVPRACHHPGPG